MRIIFMGTPAPAARLLKVLLDAHEDVVAVFTQPDRPKGRGLTIKESAVKTLARENKLTVFQPEKFNADDLLSVTNLQPDLIIVVAYGEILPKNLLDIPKYGCINVHASLLPKYRGAAPIQWAIFNGEKETGITIMKIFEKLDAGDILLQEKVPIAADDTSATLEDKLFKAGTKILPIALNLIKTGKAVFKKQDEKLVTLAPSLKKEQGKIDWKNNAEKINNMVRAFDPWPGAFTYINNKLLKVWRAKILPNVSGAAGKILEIKKNEGFVVGCGQGALLITDVQLEGKNRQTAYQFVIGHRLEINFVLS